MTYKQTNIHTNTVRIHLANTGLAVLAPITARPLSTSQHDFNCWTGIWNGMVEWKMEWNGHSAQWHLTRVAGAVQSRLSYVPTMALASPMLLLLLSYALFITWVNVIQYIFCGNTWYSYWCMGFWFSTIPSRTARPTGGKLKPFMALSSFVIAECESSWQRTQKHKYKLPAIYHMFLQQQ